MTYEPDSKVRWIVVHYSATFTDTVYTYERLEADHLARGFREGGYHAYLPIRRNVIIEGRDLSQPGRFETGAHSQGENDESIGICYEGGLTRETGPNVGVKTLTASQEKRLIRWITEQLKRFPNAEVVGHRDMPGAATQCPGFDVRAWWHEVQRGPTDHVRQPLPKSKPARGNGLAAVFAKIFEMIAALWRQR